MPKTSKNVIYHPAFSLNQILKRTKFKINLGLDIKAYSSRTPFIQISSKNLKSRKSNLVSEKLESIFFLYWGQQKYIIKFAYSCIHTNLKNEFESFWQLLNSCDTRYLQNSPSAHFMFQTLKMRHEFCTM